MRLGSLTAWRAPSWLALLLVVVPAGFAAAAKIPLKSADGLPRYTYTLSAPVLETLQSEPLFGQLTTQVRADIEADLDKYQIDDPTLLKRLYAVLLNLDLVEGRFDAALQRIQRLRELEEHLVPRLTENLDTEAYILAHQEAGSDLGQLKAALRRILAEKVRRLPWGLISADIIERKQQAEAMTAGALVAIVQRQLEPLASANGGEIAADTAYSLISMQATLQVRVVCRAELLAAYSALIEEQRTPRQDIWAERAVSLKPDDHRKPVVVAIWDFGVDTRVFPDQLYVDSRESANSRADDDNGFVDDLHGIAFNLDGQRVPELLPALTGLHRPASELLPKLKGFLDTRAGLTNADTEAANRLLAGLSADEASALNEDFIQISRHCAGTHAGGIVATGNPFARLLVARVTYDYHVVPRRETPESAARDVHAVRATMDHFKNAGVRVVNIGWTRTRGQFEAPVAPTSNSADTTEQFEQTRKVFQTWREGVLDAMRAAPDILFVVGLGGIDMASQVADFVPAGLDLPNLLVVGAVDQAGEPVRYTSFVDAVRVYANACGVEGPLPGGDKVKLSGLLVATPQVTNLAAKLVALDPTLKPREIIDRIVKNADRVESIRPLLLINPKRTLEPAH